MLPAETEDLLEVIHVGGKILAEDEDIIHVDKTEGQLTQDEVHHALKIVPSIPEAKGHPQKLKHPCFLHGREFSLGGGQLLRIQELRFSKHKRTRLSQKMMADLVARFRGREPIGREDIWKLGEEIGDAMRIGEKGSTET